MNEEFDSSLGVLSRILFGLPNDGELDKPRRGLIPDMRRLIWDVDSFDNLLEHLQELKDLQNSHSPLPAKLRLKILLNVWEIPTFFLYYGQKISKHQPDLDKTVEQKFAELKKVVEEIAHHSTGDIFPHLISGDPKDD